MDEDSPINFESGNGVSKQLTPETSLSEIEVRNKEIIDEFERKLGVGEIVKSLEDAYLLYCEYGFAKGFSVRKGKHAFFHDKSGELYMKEFDCSCNGTKDKKRSSTTKQATYLKMETRTGCNARLRVGRLKNEEWKITIFHIEHNHDMVASDKRYMLRYARNISYAKGDTLKALVDAGFSISNAYSYMQQESHGRENIGFLKKDAYDYINRLAKDHRNVEDGDAACCAMKIRHLHVSRRPVPHHQRKSQRRPVKAKARIIIQRIQEIGQERSHGGSKTFSQGRTERRAKELPGSKQ